MGMRNVFEIISKMRLAAFLLLLQTAGGFSAANTDDFPTTNITWCPLFTTQGDLDLEQIKGKWYVVEIDRHAVSLYPTANGHTELKVCPEVDVQFLSPTSPILRWTEKAGNVEYFFDIPDYGALGIWRSRGLQNGTLLSRTPYTQFRGTVYVMKAVATHMVLTFCANTADNDKYSFLLSREPDISDNDRTGVRDLLSRRGLTNAGIKETCTSSGNRRENSNVTRWITVVVTAVTAAILSAAFTTTTTTINSFVI